ncbi:MAG: hypothetical protein Kow0042_09270 [Calditrichia bacterium]
MEDRKKKFPLSYRTIQRIKADEYERFFTPLEEYYYYINHLGEIRWMTEDEAALQHEFFLHEETTLQRWKRRLRLRKKYDLSKLSEAERELRLRIRSYLEKTVLGEIRPETAQLLPAEWKYELSDEEIANIPITIDLDTRGIWKNIVVFLSLLVTVIIVSYFLIFPSSKSETGRLLVRGDVVGARVYLDGETFLGYSNKTLENVPPGLHRISAFKEGYVTIPQYHEIEIKPDSLNILDFQFKLARSQVHGYIQVKSEQNQSKLFVDNRFLGFLSGDTLFALEEGQHTIAIQKEGFVSQPAEKVIFIAAGDTSLISFFQLPLTPSRIQSEGDRRSRIGSIEVTSDVKNAWIFINGRKTGNRTDYIFTQYPLGQYYVTVEREGYEVYPEGIEVNLTRRQPSAKAAFHLVGKFSQVTISTNPPEGEIFIDGEYKARGSYRGELTVGEHTLSFGELKGYKTPEPIRFEIKPGSRPSFNMDYIPEIHIVAGIDSRGIIYCNGGELQTGYTYPNRAFSASSDGGPSVEFNEVIKDYLLKLGFAFTYRKPPGSDAVRVEFQLPGRLDTRQTYKVRITAAASNEKYPLAVRPEPLSEEAGAEIVLKFNNNRIGQFYKPKFLEELKGLEVVEMEVSSYVRPGINSFEISTGDRNAFFYYLKRIEIFN